MKRKIFFFLFLLAALAVGLWQLSKMRTFQLAGTLISRVPTSDPLIALTFDDGPTPEYTDEVLSTLNKFNIPATFFVTGRETEQHMWAAKRIVGAGHELGNHSYSHQEMILKSTDFIREEIERTDKAIRKAGYRGPIYFRPPYGKKLLMLPWFLKQQGRATVTWDIEPESYDRISSSPLTIADYIERQVQPGSIILLHVMYESGENSRKSLPIFIRNLKRKGYRFVTVSELIQKSGAAGR